MNVLKFRDSPVSRNQNCGRNAFTVPKSPVLIYALAIFFAVGLSQPIFAKSTDTPGFSETRIEMERPARPLVPPGTAISKTIAFRVVTIDPKLVQISMKWKKPNDKPYSLLKDLRDSIVLSDERFLFATNGGIYDKAYRPLGLYVENGKVLRALNHSHAPGGNFSMIPNGIFLLRGDKGALPEVIDSTEYKDATGIQFATQSGPLLLRKGKFHPDFKPGSLNLKLRSGVGINQKHEVVFAISDGFVSFYEFAQFFKTELHCDDALYLDGTISQFLVGLEAPETQYVPFAGMITATLRAGNSTAH